MMKRFFYYGCGMPADGRGRAVMAQNTKVTGQVLDENGDPVIGASIVVKGTTIGTVTDFSGNISVL